MLFARKPNMLTISGLRWDLVGVTMFPVVLNTLSDPQHVAHMQIYFLDTFAKKGTDFQYLSTKREGPALCWCGTTEHRWRFRSPPFLEWSDLLLQCLFVFLICGSLLIFFSLSHGLRWLRSPTLDDRFLYHLLGLLNIRVIVTPVAQVQECCLAHKLPACFWQSSIFFV